MMTPVEHRAAMMGLRIAHITSPAENRMRERNAKQQLSDALAASAAERKPPVFPAPDDSEDDSSLRTNMLT